MILMSAVDSVEWMATLQTSPHACTTKVRVMTRVIVTSTRVLFLFVASCISFYSHSSIKFNFKIYLTTVHL